MMRTEWYAIKARPGTQRKASPPRGETEEGKGQFIIERSLRNAGFEVFMPSFRRDIKHHRTRGTAGAPLRHAGRLSLS